MLEVCCCTCLVNLCLDLSSLLCRRRFLIFFQCPFNLEAEGERFATDLVTSSHRLVLIDNFSEQIFTLRLTLIILFNPF